MKDENKVISFEIFELKANYIRYCDMYKVSMSESFRHLSEAEKRRETKLYYFKEFYVLLKKSGYINSDSPQFEELIDEIYPTHPKYNYDKRLHCLCITTTQNEVYEFWEDEAYFDIFEKLKEIKEATGKRNIKAPIHRL